MASRSAAASGVSSGLMRTQICVAPFLWEARNSAARTRAAAFCACLDRILKIQNDDVRSGVCALGQFSIAVTRNEQQRTSAHACGFRSINAVRLQLATSTSCWL